MQALTKKWLRDLKGLSGQLAAIIFPDGKQPMISQLYLREGRLSNGVMVSLNR